MALLEYKPCIRGEDAIIIARDFYGIVATAKALPGERDQNFRLDAQSGECFVLKVANALEDRTQLEIQNQAMVYLETQVPLSPRVFPAKNGEFIAEVHSASGWRHDVRLLSYMPGSPLAEIKRHSSHLLEDLGRCVGRLDRALTGFDHPGAHRNFHWDLANALGVVREYLSLITDRELKKQIEQCVTDFERYVVSLLPGLRKSVIHNDANDYNVIVGGSDDIYSRNQRVVGIIDFGDMVHSFTVADLAIAIAYAILDKPDPLATAVQVVKGYHAEYPLDDVEIVALFGLIRMRLCASVCLAAYQKQHRPDDEYLTISQLPIRNTLPALAEIHPRFAEAQFRYACGLPPVPRATSLCSWLTRNNDTFAPVLGSDPCTEPAIVFDLSVGSPLVSGSPELNEEPALTKRLFMKMADAGAKVGIGRYDEPRLLQTSDLFKTTTRASDEIRTVHLGMDLFAEAGTPVFSPLKGKVYAFANNKTYQDYGPVILLKHSGEDGEPFYTLYGHLSEESIEGLREDRDFQSGEQIGTIGVPAVNGGWSPHLHFQIIVDLLDLCCDFPGVCRASERQIWTGFSPDPNLILRVPLNRFPPRTPRKEETLAVRKKRIGRNLSIGYRDPVKVERGWMQYLYDDTGRKFLDAYNNVPHVGHCHPRVVEAGYRQMTVLNTNTRYLHDFINQYAERLCATMPEPLSVCFFVNSASEGNELALRLARSHTKQRDMIVLEGAYHGHTTSLIDISPYKHDGPGGAGAPLWVHTAPVADVYRGPYKADDPAAARKYAQHVLRITEDLRKKGIGLAGFIAESCPSVGGQIFFPPGYLQNVYQYVREAGGLCIADEVQTGYGRTGTHFYAFEAQDVVPDIVILGKPIGNGHPISAVVTTPEIAESFDNGMEFFSTFGGNTVSCAIGMAVLEVMQEENLQTHSLRVGDRLMEGLRPLKDRYAIVGDVRGSGLFAGIELVRNRETLQPAGEEAAFVTNRMRDHGILIGTDGPYHNVVKIRPPMPFSDSDADFLVATMNRILSEDFEENRR